ncbi:Nucleoside-diphosphate kinase [Zostera marina]|uniref:Nucleoside diphosphate kinase n=1 Tax=Zostera marina TaxID=29655 RepID=A0A0K9NQG0_ZOSMR|nr:Nucleoside-diphosphate kinase [Zostera marina]
MAALTSVGGKGCRFSVAGDFSRRGGGGGRGGVVAMCISVASNRSNQFKHLSSFHSSPLLASFSQKGRIYAKTKAQKSETQIFLPHLIASLESVEQSYVMIKPDGVQRGLVGEIITRFEKKGFVLKGLKLFQCPQELAEEHYKDLKSKSFFPKLIEYITSGPVVCMAWEGVGVVLAARKLIGSTNPLQAEPGTIRGDLAVQTGRNVIHGSDSPDNGQREIGLWFNEVELCQWIPAQRPWLYE